MSVEGFVDKTLKLLEKERNAEVEETKSLTEKLPDTELQRRGVCLLKLHIESRRTGLYGRIVVVFQTHHETLPSHNITPGDIVGLSAHGDCKPEQLNSGIVTRVIQSAVSVAFDDTQDLFSLDDDGKYKLTKLANDVTYKRLKRTLKNLRRNSSGPATRLTDVLFGQQELSPPLEIHDIELLNKDLDDSQREAVAFALTQREVAVVHGPPGTGKTTTVIEIIQQAIRQGNKVLACAPSNIAVDNLVERLAVGKHKIVRIGHPARVLPHIQKYSLDAILSTSDETKLVEDVRKDLDATLSSIRKTRDRGEKQKLREDMKFLRKELKTRRDTATRSLLKRANVVLVTLTSATDDGPIRLLDESHFDMVVIDEVSQALEAACWIPLLRTGKCVLAGDHLQLPPTILSKEAAKDGLEVTLMERVLHLHGNKVMKMLTTQYRMHEKIMRWSSDQLYESKLVAHASVESHLLRDLAEVEDNDLTTTPLLLIDTAGCDLYELDLPEEISKGNEGEADIVAAHVGKLISCGVREEDIAVIAPYNLQVELIRLRLGPTHPKVEVKSVDGFQGREKEAVVISLVRSNKKGEVGFLSERRRINVAVTRARRHLAVIGDSETVSRDDFLKSLVDYLTSHGDVQTAQQFIQDGCVHQSSAPRPDHLDNLMSMGKMANKGARPKVSKPQKKTDTRKTDKFEYRPEQTTSEVDKSDSRVQELQNELDGFVSNLHADTLEFPSTLTARDRFLVHELSEKLGLSHISKGTAEDRHIVVSKPGSSTTEDEVWNICPVGPADQKLHASGETLVNSYKGKMSKSQTESSKSERVATSTTGMGSKDNSEGVLEDQNQKVEIEDKETVGTNEKAGRAVNDSKPNTEGCRDGKVVCKICGKDVLRANIQLHELHCAKAEKGKKETGKHNPSKNVSTSAKSRQFDKELAERINKVDSDDLDSLIATVKNMDNFCCVKKCKTSVQTLFNLCKFCEGRYCMSHHMPEVHGCGDAARAAARAQISKDGVLHRGSGAPVRKPNADKKAQLHRKLDSKLTEMASKRKGKPNK